MKTFMQFLTENELTLQYHDRLNPKLWSGDKLRPEVKNKLGEIADSWAAEALIPQDAIVDVVIVGGNANFNYTEFSDLDLHLIVNKSKIADCENKLLDEYLLDKKQLWGITHDVRIYGIPVEVYAQDLSEKTSKDQGVYSIIKNDWIKKPTYKKIDLDDPHIKRKAKNIEDDINYFMKSKIDDLALLEKFKEKLRLMRKAAVQTGGEFSIENLVFKELRNRGLLDKLTDYINSVEDEKLSLKKKDKK